MYAHANHIHASHLNGIFGWRIHRHETTVIDINGTDSVFRMFGKCSLERQKRETRYRFRGLPSISPNANWQKKHS